MIDGCGREIDHLRLSLTDHCNMACRYCVPEDAPTRRSAPGEIDLLFAFEVVRWLSERHGVRHVRLTGGEPLLYSGLLRLVEQLSPLETLHEITLTSNAQALAHQAPALRAAGLTRVNVSLDTLKPDRFAYVTRGGELAHTLAGIEAAVDCGLTPVKVNVVAQRDVNDEEIADMAEWGLSRGCIVRFMEVMPIGPFAHVADKHLVPASEILDRLRERFELKAVPLSLGQPATEYVATGAGVRGIIGVIAPTTRPFCARCRRIRVTHEGRLVACVHDSTNFDLSPYWDGRHLDVKGADETLLAAINGKPEVGPQNQSLTMKALGG